MASRRAYSQLFAISATSCAVILPFASLAFSLRIRRVEVNHAVGGAFLILFALLYFDQTALFQAVAGICHCVKLHRTKREQTFIADANEIIRPDIALCALVHDVHEGIPQKALAGREFFITRILHKTCVLPDIVDNRHTVTSLVHSAADGRRVFRTSCRVYRACTCCIRAFPTGSPVGQGPAFLPRRGQAP